MSLSIWFPMVLEYLSILKVLSPYSQRGQTYPTHKIIFCQVVLIVSIMCANKREHKKDASNVSLGLIAPCHLVTYRYRLTEIQ